MNTKTVFKKITKIIIAALVIAGSITNIISASAGSVTLDVAASNSVISVDGIPTMLSGYKIGGSNYCKIRDVASVMNGTTGEFDVSYSQEYGTLINAATPYLGAVNELKKPGTASSVTPHTSTVTLNGEQVLSLSTFLIDGEYYYKLKDIADCLGYELVTADSISVDIITKNSICATAVLPQASPTYDAFSKTNLSAAQFEKMVYGTGLAGLGPCFYAMERDADINGLFALAVACEESGSGTSGLAREDNNFYGLTALGGGWRSFPTRSEGIQYFKTYITSSLYAGKSIYEISQTYCPGNDEWVGKIQRFMLEKYALIDPSVLETD